MKKIISANVDGVKCVIGQSTSKSNTITMRISAKDVIPAVEFFDLKRNGEQPEQGLIGYELVAVYADELEVDPDEGKQDDLDLEIVEEEDPLDAEFPGCEKCVKNPYHDGAICSEDCCHSSISGSGGSPDLFEVIPKSQRL